MFGTECSEQILIFKKSQKGFKYDYISVMANHFSGCRLKGQLSFDDPDPRTPGTPEFP